MVIRVAYDPYVYRMHLAGTEPALSAYGALGMRMVIRVAYDAYVYRMHLAATVPAQSAYDSLGMRMVIRVPYDSYVIVCTLLGQCQLGSRMVR